MPAVGEIEFARMDGSTGTLGDYAGDVVLVVNVASQCGLTPQYEALQALYEARKDDGLTIIGFPANNFGAQEPGTDEEIAEFCSTTYAVSFPVVSKISVVGDDQHPLYAELTAAIPEADGKAEMRESLRGFDLDPSDDPDVLWNFEKFLIGRDGNVVARFSPPTKPDDLALVGAIEAELAGVSGLDAQPFRVEIDDAAIAELRDRLSRTRWPDPESVDDWSQGIPLSYVQELCRWWADEYDFGLADRVNVFPQEKATIDGLAIHYLHVRSPEPDARPLVLTHGWPGSVTEFLDVLGPLSDPRSHGGDPADAFHVVAPSLPGYGWSDKPSSGNRWGIERIASAWDTLMTGLGYDRYLAQGGDWGGGVAHVLGMQAPAGLAAIHLNFALAFPDLETMDSLTEQEIDALAGMADHAETGMGYSSIQSTKPQTLGYGLTDSPAGQLAWIVEKFHAWTDNDGHPEDALSRQQMLDDVSTYWFTETAVSSARLYWESFKSLQEGGPVGVPTGITVFPNEILRMSRRWAERVYSDLTWFEIVEKGGHFAALEQPELFVDQVRGCFHAIR